MNVQAELARVRAIAAAAVFAAFGMGVAFGAAVMRWVGCF